MKKLAIGLMSTSVLLLGLANARAETTPDDAKKEITKALGFFPSLFKAVPKPGLPGVWLEFKGLVLGQSTALPNKVKELVALGVSAQIPCEYCVYAHTKFAQAYGATQAEIDEALMMAAMARHWSTYVNGLQPDETKFRAEIKKILENAAQPSKGTTPVEVTDRDSALASIRQSFGFVPEFIGTFPPEGLAGAWRQMRDVEMSPSSALPGKYKSMIGLGVAAQIPCRYCVIADTEFARADGATDAEIREAVAVAAFTRELSTILNGRQLDMKTFRKDIDKIVKMMKAKSEKHASK